MLDFFANAQILDTSNFFKIKKTERKILNILFLGALKKAPDKLQNDLPLIWRKNKIDL